MPDLLVKRAGDGRRSRLVTDLSCDDASVQLSDGPFSPAVYSEEGGEWKKEGERREGEDQITE